MFRPSLELPECDIFTDPGVSWLWYCHKGVIVKILLCIAHQSAKNELKSCLYSILLYISIFVFFIIGTKWTVFTYAFLRQSDRYTVLNYSDRISHTTNSVAVQPCHGIYSMKLTVIQFPNQWLCLVYQKHTAQQV